MRSLICCAAVAVLALPLAGQNAPAEKATPTLHTGTRLVVVDVTVTDAHGTPVRGLGRAAFHVSESKRLQAILSFEEHSGPASANAAAPAPSLQPGVFTNVGAGSAEPTPTILLLDYLNTPRDNATMAGQIYLRKQVLDYLRTAPPNRRISIFGLNSTLVQLQRFTDDPALLRAAIERSQSHSSAVSNLDSDPDWMDKQLGAGVEAQAVSFAAANASDKSQTAPPPSASAAASFDLFNAIELNINEDQRATMTLKAFHQLAVYLAQIPGRKNLIWFSGAFPLTLLPVADVVVPFNGDPAWKGLYRETVDMLARSRVAVYAVDARGLMLQRADNMVVETQAAMMEMAEDTGGKAYLNTNGLAQAIADVVDNGSDYYTLAYDPTDKDKNGELRPIHVALDGGKGYKLEYRRGYYADAQDTGVTGSAVQVAAAYMSPPSTQIPFFARVLPVDDAGMKAETPTAGTGKVMAEPDASQGQSRHAIGAGSAQKISVEYSADVANLMTVAASGGMRQAHLEFIARAYDGQGRVVGSEEKRVRVTWTREQFAQVVQHGVRYQQEVSVPAGDYPTLRLVIHDLGSDHVGSLDVYGAALKVEKP